MAAWRERRRSAGSRPGLSVPPGRGFGSPARRARKHTAAPGEALASQGCRPVPAGRGAQSGGPRSMSSSPVREPPAPRLAGGRVGRYGVPSVAGVQ